MLLLSALSTVVAQYILQTHRLRKYREQQIVYLLGTEARPAGNRLLLLRKINITESKWNMRCNSSEMDCSSSDSIGGPRMRLDFLGECSKILVDVLTMFHFRSSLRLLSILSNRNLWNLFSSKFERRTKFLIVDALIAVVRWPRRKCKQYIKTCRRSHHCF